MIPAHHNTSAAIFYTFMLFKVLSLQFSVSERRKSLKSAAHYVTFLIFSEE